MCNFNPNTAYMNLVWYKMYIKTLSSFFSKAAIWHLSPFATQPFINVHAHEIKLYTVTLIDVLPCLLFVYPSCHGGKSWL